MLVKFIQKPSASNRGQAGGLLKYIFGATKDTGMKIDGHRHTGDAQKVHFVSASKNMCIVDPLYIETEDGMMKINGQDADLSEIINQFSDSESRNKRAEYPLEHIVVTLPENESLTVAQWADAVEFLIDYVGYKDCTWICTLHEDSDNQHCHIALCNISNEPPHNSVNPSNKWQLATQARVILEHRFGLSHDASPLIDREKDFNPNLGKNFVKNTVREAIRSVIDDHGKMPLPKFMKEMQKHNIGVFASLKSNETQVQGLSFSFNGQRIAASKLGAGFSSKEIMKDVEYNKERDRDEVTLLNECEKVRMQAYDDIKQYASEKSDNFAIAGLTQEQYIVTIMTKDEIASTFEKDPIVAAPVSSMTGSFVCALKAKINDSDDSSLSPILEFGGESYSKYLERVEKKKASLLKRKIAKQQEEHNKRMRELLIALMRAFNFSSPLNHQQHYKPIERNYKTPNLLSERYKRLNARSSVVLISRDELLDLLHEANGNAVKLFRANEMKYERFAYLSKSGRVVIEDKPKAGGKRCFMGLDDERELNYAI